MARPAKRVSHSRDPFRADRGTFLGLVGTFLSNVILTGSWEAGRMLGPATGREGGGRVSCCRPRGPPLNAPLWELPWPLSMG